MTSQPPSHEYDVVIIGAGPAGIAAAEVTARAGLAVALVDENDRIGGQIRRQRLDDGTHAMPGPALPPGVTFLARTMSVGIHEGFSVSVDTEGAGGRLTARHVVVATGALEQAYPVPGWTIPGVMTAGAAQTLLKGSGVFPFGSPVVAGTGPLLLATASQLIRAGVRVAAVVEANRPGWPGWRALGGLALGGRVLGQGARYVTDIARTRVPLLLGHGVATVHGDPSVSGVEVQRLGNDWQPAPGAPRRLVECDSVLFNYGFGCATDLLAQAGAGLTWDSQARAWCAERSPDLETTVPGLFAAGDCAGVAGHELAALEGELAGWAIVRRLSPSSGDDRRRRTAEKRHRRITRFHEALDPMFRVRPGVNGWMTPETTVCRCQEVPAASIAAAIRAGADSFSAVKLRTRAGMGLCQGRTCRHIVQSMLDDAANPGPEPPRVRYPVRPVSVAALGQMTATYPPAPIPSRDEERSA